jgi:trimeric autotransporter adhesin
VSSLTPQLAFSRDGRDSTRAGVASRTPDGLSRRPSSLHFICATACFSLALSGCGGGAQGSGPTDSATISQVTPSSAVVGSGQIVLLLTGSNYLATSYVQWNGLTRQGTVLSSTQLQVTIPSSDMTSAGLAAITVVNPQPSGGTSNAVIFTINNPVPVLNGISPVAAVYGATFVSLTLHGSGFSSSATALWNGTALPTTLVSEVELYAVVPGSALASVGSAAVTIGQAGPGGGTSLPIIFNVTASYPAAEIAQAAGDMRWDESNGLIYLSVPSAAATYANSVIALDPEAGTIVASQFVGGEPSRLALSDDSQFLYVGLNNASSVERLTLPSLQQSLEYSLGSSQYYGPYFALEIEVAPGLPHTAAISLGGNVVPPAVGGIEIFDDATPRATAANSILDEFDT